MNVHTCGQNGNPNAEKAPRFHYHQKHADLMVFYNISFSVNFDAVHRARNIALCGRRF